MSLRALALELYDLEKRVAELIRALGRATPEQHPEQHQDIELELLRAKAERDRLRAVLQAKKDAPAGRPSGLRYG